MIAAEQAKDSSLSGWYNVGPDECDCLTTGELTDLFCKAWGSGASWVDRYDGGPHEANFLKLDCSQIKQVFGWHPTWHIEETVRRIVDWTKIYLEQGNIPAEMDKEIRELMEGCK